MMSEKIMTKKQKPVDLAVNLWDKAEVVKGGGLVKLLQKSDYEGYPVYIMMIGDSIFIYFVIYNGELYTGYNVITPEKGKKKLTKDQIAQCGALIFTGAITTIDNLLDINKPLVKSVNNKVN